MPAASSRSALPRAVQSNWPRYLRSRPSFLRRLAKIKHWPGVSLAISVADPFPGQAEIAERGLHVDRGQVSGAGQLDPARTDPVEQSSVRTDNTLRRARIDADRAAELGCGDELAQRPQAVC